MCMRGRGNVSAIGDAPVCKWGEKMSTPGPGPTAAVCTCKQVLVHRGAGLCPLPARVERNIHSDHNNARATAITVGQQLKNVGQ